jgi:hypothetical protein
MDPLPSPTAQCEYRDDDIFGPSSQRPLSTLYISTLSV